MRAFAFILLVACSPPRGTDKLPSLPMTSPTSLTAVAQQSPGKTSVVELGVARAGLAAATLADGSVLVAGGWDRLGYVAAVDLIREGDDTTSAMTVARSDGTLTAVGLAAIATGGWSVVGAAPEASVEAYDGGAWHSMASMAVGRAAHSASRLPDGKLVVIGGYAIDGATDSVEIFDGLAWRAGPTLPSPRAEHTAITLADGRILVIGGYNDGAWLDSTLVFDGDAFIAGPSLTAARSRATATLLPDGRVLAVGGATVAIVASAELIDVGAGTSTSLPTRVARYGHGAALLSGGKVAIVGGEDQLGSLSSTEIFDGTAFVDGPSLPAPRAHAGIVAVGDHAFMAGGFGATDFLADFRTFDK